MRGRQEEIAAGDDHQHADLRDQPVRQRPRGERVAIMVTVVVKVVVVMVMMVTVVMMVMMMMIVLFTGPTCLI